MNWSHVVWQLKCFLFVQGVCAAGRGWCILWCTLWEEASLGGEVPIWLFQGPTICWLHFKLVWSLLLGAMAIHCSLDTWVYVHDGCWVGRRPKYSCGAYLMSFLTSGNSLVVASHRVFVSQISHLQLNIQYSWIHKFNWTFTIHSLFINS